MAPLRELLRSAVEAEIAIVATDLSVGASQLVHDPDDLELLADLNAMRDQLDQLEVLIVALLRANAVSWDSIATTLNVTRQSAHRRLSRRVDELLHSLKEPAESREYWTRRQRDWTAAVQRMNAARNVIAGLDDGTTIRRRRTARRTTAT